MPDVALYLFDASNLFHAGRFAHRDELVDELALSKQHLNWSAETECER